MNRAACLLAYALAAFASPAEAASTPVADDELIVWHAYRASEKVAITRALDDIDAEFDDIRLRVLPIPYDAFVDKITAAVPRGRGPDLFIAAHDLIGDWAEASTVAPVDALLDAQLLSSLLPGLVEPLTYKGKLYGLPLAFKSLALWRNKELVPDAPTTLSEFVGVARRHAGDSKYGLAYVAGDFYEHAPFLFGFGGRLFDDDGKPELLSDQAVRAVTFVQSLASQKGLMPKQVDVSLVGSLFTQKKVAFIMTGPWSLGEVGGGAGANPVDYGVSPLPVVDVDGLDRPMSPLLTIEAVMISGKSKKYDRAAKVARRLLDPKFAALRLTVGKQPVSTAAAWKQIDKVGGNAGNALVAFRKQLETATPTPNTPAMKSLWSPANLALGESIGQGAPPSVTLAAAQKKVDGVLADTAALDDKRDPTGFLISIAVLFGLLCVFLVVKLVRYGPGRMVREAADAKVAYLYVAPTVIGLLVLVVTPFFFGISMGFFRHAWGRYVFVGWQNFERILVGADSTFFRILGMTVLWTSSNVFLHVAIGLFLALILSQTRLRFRGVYRVLFILPWAIPNYITALIWRGMFNPDFGAINAALGTTGFAWMNQTWSAFLANLATNTWLGFPFMMVTALGGLSAIPDDLYEAAHIDGAGPLQRFWSITVPLLVPTLAPAIVLGSIWTFNMFNVIYLVSGGAPGGTTDILITEAFRWAFERGQGGAFGYAASYSTLIFLMLLAYSSASDRVTRKIAGTL